MLGLAALLVVLICAGGWLTRVRPLRNAIYHRCPSCRARFGRLHGLFCRQEFAEAQALAEPDTFRRTMPLTDIDGIRLGLVRAEAAKRGLDQMNVPWEDTLTIWNPPVRIARADAETDPYVWFSVADLIDGHHPAIDLDHGMSARTMAQVDPFDWRAWDIDALAICQR